MTMLRRMAVLAVLGAFATTTQAQDSAPAAAPVEAGGGGGGWDTKYGLLFDLQNVFQNGDRSVVGSYGGGVGVGAQLNLANTRALRLYVNLARASDPPYEETSLAGTAKVVPTWTSQYDADVGAAYMIRLGTGSIAPYLGAGASVSFAQRSRSGDARAAGSTVTTSIDDTERTIGLGLDGMLGVEWRVHRALAIFAEYMLDVTAYQRTTGDYYTTTAGTVDEDSNSTQSKFLNFNTGVGQAGQIGVLAFF